MTISSPRRNGAGFTIVELLVVIAIIAVLTALIVSGSAYANKVVKIRRVETELNEIVSAIESYKAKTGFYPPDGANPNRAPLFYELLGVYQDPVTPTLFVTSDGSTSIDSTLANTTFGVEGFANTAPTQAEARGFLKDVIARKIQQQGGVSYLRTSVENPEGTFIPRWSYVSRNPTNNPGSFDLWTRVIIRGETNIISNWRKGS